MRTWRFSLMHHVTHCPLTFQLLLVLLLLQNCATVEDCSIAWQHHVFFHYFFFSFTLKVAQLCMCVNWLTTESSVTEVHLCLSFPYFKDKFTRSVYAITYICVAGWWYTFQCQCPVFCTSPLSFFYLQLVFCIFYVITYKLSVGMSTHKAFSVTLLPWLLSMSLFPQKSWKEYMPLSWRFLLLICFFFWRDPIFIFF